MTTPTLVATSKQTLKPVPKMWTKHGLSILGKLIRDARMTQALSLDDVALLIHEATGYKLKISKKTIGNVENNVGEPKYNTIAAIAAASFVINPSNGKPFTVEDFIDIACELLDPFNQKWCMSTGEFIALLKKEMANSSIKEYAQKVELPEIEIQNLLNGSAPTPEQIYKLAKHITNPATNKNRDIEWLARLAGIWKEEPFPDDEEIIEEGFGDHLLEAFTLDGNRDS